MNDVFILVIDVLLLLVVLRTANFIDYRTHWQIKLSYFVLAVGVFAHLLRYVPAVARVCPIETLHGVSDTLIAIGILCVLQLDRRGENRNSVWHRFKPGDPL